MYFTLPQFINVAHTSTVKRIYCNILGHQNGKREVPREEGPEITRFFTSTFRLCFSLETKYQHKSLSAGVPKKKKIHQCQLKPLLFINE